MKYRERELFVFGLSIGLAAGLVLGIGLRALWSRNGHATQTEVVR